MAVFLYSTRMLFDLFLVRENGWIMPRWRSSVIRPIRGELQLNDRQDEILNRMTRVAVLLNENTGAPLPEVAPLLDAVLLRFEKKYLVLSGIERRHDPIIDRYYDHAQTWMLEACN